MATGFIGRLGAKIIASTGDILGGRSQETGAVSLSKPDSAGQQLKRMPNSIDALNPRNRFVTTLAELPTVKGVPYHSIIGDRGKGGNLSHTKPVSTDGIVPYWSSHLDGATSEVIIPSHHWTNQHPMGIAEVRRILHQHVGKEMSRIGISPAPEDVQLAATGSPPFPDVRARIRPLRKVLPHRTARTASRW